MRCEAYSKRTLLRCSREARWVIEHRAAAVTMQVCTQHEWHITTGDPKTDADLKKDIGWTLIDIIQSKKEAPK